MVIVATEEALNTKAIAPSTQGVIILDHSILSGKTIGSDDSYFNRAFLINNSGEEIRVTIGSEKQRIASGDAFEWTALNPIMFAETVFIDNLDAANTIAIGELILMYRREK